MRLMAFVFVLLPALAFADVVAGCNYNLQGYRDRGSVMVFDRGGSLTLQIVLDDAMDDFSKVSSTAATGDQVRAEASKNALFNKELGNAHVFPSDVRSMKAYVAQGAPSGNATSDTSATYYAFYGDQNVYLGGFGTLGKDWYTCDWQ